MLAGLAGVLGLGLAALSAHLLAMGFEPLMAPYWIDFGLNGRVLAFVILTCLSTVVIFGLAPALHTSKANVRGLVTTAGRIGAAASPPHRWMGVLVISELALTLVLLAGAGLMARSLLTVALANRVIDTAGVTTMQLFLPDDRYPTAEQRMGFFRALHEQAAAHPMIASATHAGAIPFAPHRHVPRTGHRRPARIRRRHTANRRRHHHCGRLLRRAGPPPAARTPVHRPRRDRGQ